MEWIKCSDRLPYENQDVLVFLKSGIISIERITFPKDGNLWSCIDKHCITHWMPLPNLPEVL